MKLIVIAFIAALAVVGANCPNSCSGHGTCGAHDKCTCYPNYHGQDCSLRTCAYGVAWVDTPSANEQGHGYAECSNKGVCDTKTGQCKCFAGYEGQACARASCPSACSGHGVCQYMKSLAKDTSVQVGGVSGRKYETSWDAKKIQGCKCDPGYMGVDCSKKMCPKGDDPLTTANTASEVQTVTVGNGDATNDLLGSFTLSYTDMFNAVWTTRPIVGVKVASGTPAMDQAAMDIKLALEALPNAAIKGVSVVASASTNDAVYTITFNNAPNLGNQPQLTCNAAGCTVAGCQPYFAGLSSVSATPSCTVATTTEGTHDVAVCSNRGDCDYTTGQCVCHSGYTEQDCSLQTVLL